MITLERVGRMVGFLFLGLTLLVLVQPGSRLRTRYEAWKLSRDTRDALADSVVIGTVAVRRIGAEKPLDVLLIATDYRCPYCRMLHDSLDLLLAGAQGRAVQLVYKPRDTEGVEAALGAICASRQGALRAMDQFLFAMDGQVRGIDWRRVADSLLIPDPEALAACQGSLDAREELRVDSLLLGRLRVRGTPAFLSRTRGLHVGLLSNEVLASWFDPVSTAQ